MWLVLGARVLSPVREFTTLEVTVPVTLSGLKAKGQQCSEMSDKVNCDFLSPNFKVNEITGWKLVCES